ncbi:MAG TPA: NAD(P)/FAD-dependent oxidoreductase [Candidatus Dormibacteraeota bacterium]|nr:NAD(P)/FAD-dependent oxidoreductase [Candidatus Dormibacteraeota bacterium]
MAVVIDPEALRQKYREERDKRLRPDGNDQYIRMVDHFPDYLDDPYMPVVQRAPKTDHVTFAFVGGGFAGLVTGARLKESGVTDVRIVDKGGDFGGTWYWNRYPGAQCDTASLVYMPLLEETGHMPIEKYAHAPEILEHCRRIANRYGLYDNALFHTEVTALDWDEARAVWVIGTDRGDHFTASYVGVGIGPLHVPKLPGIPGIGSFGGHAFHTSRWDYAYTGGDPSGKAMTKLRDKRVGVIGTGATAVQIVPELAAACRELYVFQRTPSSVDVRDNHPTDPAWFAGIATPGWQERWLDNFAENQSFAFPEEDLVMDGWTDIGRRIRSRVLEAGLSDFSREAIMAAFEQSDFEKMEEIRGRVDAIVKDPTTAAHLKAWYRQLCKRPCFHDEYLQAFNQPNVHLVDTDGKGVERITAGGVVVAGEEYPLDCIVYASGFETGTEFEHRSGFEIVGRDGETLSQHWRDGMRSMHGVHMHGFPNLFMVQLFQGANLISNVPHNLNDAARTVAGVVAHASETDSTRVEVTQEAEEAWMQLISSGQNLLQAPDCTPGYYNNEGHADDPQIRSLVGYPMGASAYFQYIREWRASGGFEGLEFRRSS